MPAPKGHPPYPGCEKGGRPRVWTDELIEAEADALEEWMTKKDSIWYEDFALQRGFDSDNFIVWSNRNEKFAGTYKRSKLWQKSLLFRGALLKKFNYNMAALILSHSYGINAKTEAVISGDAANPFTALVHVVQGETKELVDDKE